MLGSEEETLFDFIGGQILHRELLQDAFNSIRAGSEKVAQVQEIQRLANRKVAMAVKHTWQKAQDEALSLLPPFLSVDRLDKALSESERMDIRRLDPELRNASLRDLFGVEWYKKLSNAMQVEAEIHSKMCTALSSVVDPVIFDAASTVCVPLLEAMMEQLNTAYAEAINGFRIDMISLIDGGHLSLRNISRQSSSSHSSLPRMSDDASIIGLPDVLAAAHIRVDSGYNSGPLQASRRVLWDMYTTDLNSPEVLHCFVNKGLSAYDIHTMVSDSIGALVHNAIHTLGELLRKDCICDDAVVDSKENHTQLLCLENCIKMMTSDAKIMQHDVLVKVFQR